MAARERDEDYGSSLTQHYAEQYAGLRDGLAAVNRNVLTYIADTRENRDEGRKRGEQIDVMAAQVEAMVAQLTLCAAELGRLKSLTWAQRGLAIAVTILACGVIALLIKVF